MFEPKKFHKAVCGKHFTRLDSGVLVVNHNPADPFAPYAGNPVPRILKHMDHDIEMSKQEYKERMPKAQLDLRKLTFDHLVKSDYALIIALAGYDAAGKGGNIKRISEALGGNSKEFMPVPFGAPDPVERKYLHLKRFFDHERFPKRGEIRALDRFWYERMAVERVEELAPDEDLKRAFSEINMLEHVLVDNRYILVKFFLSISKKEQDKRFEARKKSPTQEKLDKSDFIAQEKRPLYKRCFNEMFWLNGTQKAPWTIIPANSKPFAQVTVIEAICHAVRTTLGVK